jgi:hypothetical protein
MRKYSLGAAVMAFGLLASAGQAQTAKAIKWSPNFKSAMAAAKTGDKLVMVDFYTEW